MSADRKHKIVIIGCGALGSEIARLFVQNDVGFLRLIDRDFLEMNDAETHLLFAKHAFMEGLPKSIALQEFFEAQNPAVKIDPVVEDVNRLNILPLIQDVDLIVDAVNNSFTHRLINEACVKLNKPLLTSWIDGSRGAAMAVMPGKKSCLNCLLESKAALPDISLDKIESPQPLTISAIAQAQFARAMEMLKYPKRKIEQKLLIFGDKNLQIETIDIAKSKIRPNCSVCNNRQFSRLDGKIGSTFMHPIGENSLQIIPFQPKKVDLPALAIKLSDQGDVLVNDFLLIFRKPLYELVIFPGGRTFVRGTTDSGIAMELLRSVFGNGK